MESAHKPFESLSGTEREIFRICGAIIASNPRTMRDPALLTLRVRATQLFERMQSRDITHDDSYYKLQHEAKVLEKEFGVLLNKKHNRTPVLLGDIEQPDVTIDKLVTDLHNATDLRVDFEWEEPDQDDYYTDYTSIDITNSDEAGTLKLRLNELFDPDRYEGKPHIALLHAQLPEELRTKSVIRTHRHGVGTGSIETWVTFDHIARNDARTVLAALATILKTHPRSPHPYTENE